MEKYLLSREIVKFHFGEVYAQIFWNLSTYGACGFKELVKLSKVSAGEVKQAVAVLLQQNVIFAYEKGSGRVFRNKPWKLDGEEGVEILFEAKVEEALLRLRFPRFIQLCREYYGETGEVLCQILLERGLLSFEDVIQVGVTQGRLKSSAAADSVLHKMIEEKFVCLAGYEYYEKNEKDVSSVSSGMKRKRSTDDAPSPAREADMSQRSSETLRFVQLELYRISTSFLNRILRHEAFSDLVVHTVRENSRMVASCFRAMLSLIRKEDECFEGEQSVPVQRDAILDEIRNQMPSSSELVTVDQLNEALNVLQDDRYNFISGIGISSFVVEIRMMRQLLKQRATEHLILKRHGTSGLRVYRLLLDKGALEQRQLLEFAMLPGTTAREKLYAMFRDGYVVVNEIPSSSDYKSSRSFFLWSVDVSNVFTNVLCHAYKATLNMLIRMKNLHVEYSRLLGSNLYCVSEELESVPIQQEILERHISSQSSNMNYSCASLELKERLEKLRQRMALYEVSILRLDKNIMCIRDI
ncbi:DNA-directed RNA polymerase III subunit C3 [Galdieria sulphuraria]|uniref:DNA-directed RNA polymerase III subunit RPC3 n=1 Tax=Galdieria sulphuraria TaxID=130081 RepID=M2Y148_GALSU|nr:DNA-directed RNA polymerase III subunit C3 [Galdieria sulphuraria]EME29539.1 DNA-directed RNA polymerase III subunit C3 [Galdieria sulphuraria]|eukprot:XP_005706059.1 DNA-directed RNA polymerase III subunit C3 [Galdieria sulphuraria]